MRTLLTLLEVPENQRRAMTRNEAKIFMTITMAQMASRDCVLAPRELRQRIDGDEAPFAVKVLAYRLALGGEDIRYSYGSVCFLASISKTPGGAVLWAHYLVRRSLALGRTITNDELSIDFPMGFPTEEGATAIWDAQKRRPGDPDGTPENCLDAAWPWRPQAQGAA